MRVKIRTAALFALCCLLPFEAPAPAFVAWGFEFSFLECAAALLLGICWLTLDRTALGRVRAAPLVLVLTFGFVGAHAVSAAFAPANPILAFRFTLRMAAAGLVALTLSAVGPVARRAAWVGVAGGGFVLAVVTIAAALRLPGSGEWLPIGAFFDPAASASAGHNPNLAAAFLASALVIVAGLGGAGRRGRLATYGLAAVLGIATVFMESRAGVASALVGLTAVSWALGRSRQSARGGVAALALVSAVWLLALASPERRFRFDWERRLAGYSARFEPAQLQLRFAPGEKRVLSLHVSNDGARSWPADGTLQLRVLSYRFADQTLLGAASTDVLRGLPAGGTRGIDVELEAAAREGLYVWILDGVLDGVTLLSAGKGAPAVITAVVSQEGAVPLPTLNFKATAWRRGRWALWQTALEMWRSRPLLGMGPDNFRWLHAEWAGWFPAGPPVHSAHNVPLELLATTGVVGFGACLAVIAACLAVLLRGLSSAERPVTREAAVLLGLLAASCVHGSVEYLLGFTGYYVFCGLVVGSVAAVAREAAASAARS